MTPGGGAEKAMGRRSFEVVGVELIRVVVAVVAVVVVVVARNGG